MTQVVSQEGLIAVADAKAGGFRLCISKFAVTEAYGFVAAPEDDAPLGAIVYEAEISTIEVLTGSAAVLFTCQLSKEYPASGVWKLGELALYLDNGKMFSHGTLEPVYEKDNSFALRFSVVVALEGLGDVINVTVTDTHSIPSVAKVATLPPPKEVIENTVAVLDEWENPFKRSTPSIAIRYGAGSDRWGYVGWDLVYEGPVDSVSGKNFVCNPGNHNFTIEPGEKVIVQEVISGATTEGRSHKYVFDGSKFIYLEGTTGITKTSTVAIWRREVPIIDTAFLNPGVKVYGSTRISYYNHGKLDVGLTGDGDDYFLVWAGGSFFGCGQAKDAMDTSSVATGVVMDVFLIRTRALADGEVPDVLKVKQYDFTSVTSARLTTGAKTSLEWINVFKNGQLVRYEDYDANKVKFNNYTYEASTGTVILSNDILAGKTSDVFSVVALTVSTQEGATGLIVTDTAKIAAGEKVFDVPKLNADSGLLVFEKGLLKTCKTYSVSLTGKSVTYTTVPPASSRQDFIHFYTDSLSDVGYFFAKTSDLDNLLEGAAPHGEGLQFTRHDGSTFNIALPNNYIVLPEGTAVAASSYPEGLKGIDAYKSTDFPDDEFIETDNGGVYYSGINMLYRGRGFQFAVNWNQEADVPEGAYVRIKDDTAATFGKWRRLAWADEAGSVVQVTFTATNAAINVSKGDTASHTVTIGTLTGGVAPYTLQANTLPAGVTLSVSGANVVATYTGANSTVGTGSYSFSVSDARKRVGNGVFTYTVQEVIKDIIPGQSTYTTPSVTSMQVTWTGKVTLDVWGGSGAGGNGASGGKIPTANTTYGAVYPPFSAGGGGGGAAGRYSRVVIDVKRGDVLTICIGSGGEPTYNADASLTLPFNSEYKIEHQPSVVVPFPKGSDGSPSYVQLNGSTVVYSEGGPAGESGKITAKHFYYIPNLQDPYANHTAIYGWGNGGIGEGGAGGYQPDPAFSGAAGQTATSTAVNNSSVTAGASGSGGSGNYQNQYVYGGNGGAGSASAVGATGTRGSAGAIIVTPSA